MRGELNGEPRACVDELAKKPVDASGAHPYMRLQQADAASTGGFAFVSRLL